MNFKYDEVEPKILKILYDRGAFSYSSGLSKASLYRELNTILDSYDKDKPTFDKTRFNKIIDNLTEGFFITDESEKKFYETAKNGRKPRYLTKRGRFCVEQKMSRVEIAQFQTASLLVIGLSQKGRPEIKRGSGLGSVVISDRHNKNRLHRLVKKEGITIEEFIQKINENSDEKLSHDRIITIFDLLVNEKIIIPNQISGKTRFTINPEYELIISKIGRLYDATVNMVNAKWKLFPLDRLEEQWYVTMYGQAKFTKKNSDMFDSRKLLTVDEKTLINDDIEIYENCIEHLENQINEIISNRSGNLKRYSTLFYILFTINNKNK